VTITDNEVRKRVMAAIGPGPADPISIAALTQALAAASAGRGRQHPDRRVLGDR